MFSMGIYDTSETCQNASETHHEGGTKCCDRGVNPPVSPKNSDEGKSLGKVQKSCDSGGGGDGNMNLISAHSPREDFCELTSSEIKADDPSQILSALSIKNSDRIIIRHLNINFIENKFNSLVSLIKDKLDIIIASETKIDDPFPETQFIIEGYAKPFRRDRNSHGGGLLIYVRDMIPCKEIKLK